LDGIEESAEKAGNGVAPVARNRSTEVLVLLDEIHAAFTEVRISASPLPIHDDPTGKRILASHL
jgi:hypothetical protein